MKHLLCICLLAGSLASAQAQTQTLPRLPDQYCILEAGARTKDRAKLKLLAGADPAKTGQAEEVQQVESFKYEVDALNYLSSRGWEVISVTPTSLSGHDDGVRYYLRRRKP